MPYGNGTAAGNGSSLNSGWGRRVTKDTLSPSKAVIMSLTVREMRGAFCGRGTPSSDGFGHALTLELLNLKSRGLVHAPMTKETRIKIPRGGRYVVVVLKCGMRTRLDVMTQKTNVSTPLTCMNCLGK